MVELIDLKGLGPKSVKSLNETGINSKEDLERTGAVRAFIRLKEECNITPSLNFLYAMVGALENKHWSQIAKFDKERLLFELEGYAELEEIMKTEGDEIPA